MLGRQMGTAVISGAGSGMGRATAELYLSRDWHVIAIDIADNPGIQSDNLHWVKSDVRNRKALEAELVQAVAAAGGQVDAVANIAGVFPPTTLETFTDEDFRFIFDVNVLGVLNVTAACVPFMKPGSAVVNFASVDGFTVSRGQLLYGASKSAVIMITKSLALELAPKGIRVNGIAPGWVATPGNAATGRMEEAAKSIPIGRVAQPSEIAEWVWLLSDPTKAGFVDGETIVISGADVMR
jgi:NAD(P)-dependent dehydrogenase (short-subunit alcohol dehydrogenase family)